MTRPASRATAILVILTVLAATGVAFAQRQSPVTHDHLRHIIEAWRNAGFVDASAVLDAKGRVELRGSYNNEQDVDRAFSIAQTTVGVRWVSPVTPERVKVKEWEECFTRIFSGGQCGPAATPAVQPNQPRADAPAGPIQAKYALVVGIGRFLYGIQPLAFANKDAYDFYTYLTTDAGFLSDNVVLLRDQNATRTNVVRALDAIVARAAEDDLVVLFFSSHGTPPDKFGGVHVVTYESEVRPRERVWTTALTDALLRDFIQKVRAKRLVVVMDACYSNGAYARVPGFLPPGGKSLGGSAFEGHGRSSRDMAQRLLGAKDLVLDDDSSKGVVSRNEGWGRILISASDAGQRSWESDTLRNSFFTKYFIDGLRRHRGAIAEAFEYAKPRVTDHVRREKGADIDQHPQLTASRRDWNVSLATGR
jgi:hypothetical protein